MPIPRGDILEHGETVEPTLRSTHTKVQVSWMHRAMRHRFSTPLKHQHPRGVIVAAPARTSRHAIVKAWQPTPRTTGAHLTYLTRQGTDGPGRRAELFTADSQSFDRATFVREALQDPGQYRLMISARDQALVDYQSLTRAFMRWIETRVLHAHVDWVAAVHRDTAHPHVHLLIRGVDAKGQEVHFTHDMRFPSMGYQVRHLLTQWLGPVSAPQDISAFESWATAHVKETQLMIDSPTEESAHETPPPKTLTPEEAQRRLEETRQRMQQMIARMNARYGVQTPANTTDDLQTRIEQLKARLSREAQQQQVRMQQATTPDRDPDGSRGMDVS